uniref:Exportin-5 n=1 Tax=Pseudonaja textilis TaxID=8673 RepID=A0A670Y659_PSETE
MRTIELDPACPAAVQKRSADLLRLRTAAFSSPWTRHAVASWSPPSCLVAVGNATSLPLPFPPPKFLLAGTMSWDPVNTLCEQLVKAVTAMMDPASTQRYRLEALKFCEEFKEKSPVCVPCGLKLAEKSQTAIVRHFGLQILEHVVKFRWNAMSRLEKVFLKNSAMALISNGTQNILEEESHIKDVLSRIVVEMIKREWPQHWPDMLKELDTLSEEGETQTELVMFILLRLAEDVVTFQTLPAQRRRDIQQTLSQNMDKIFSFLLNTLQQNVNKYRCLLFFSLQAQANCRVGIAALNTLAGYIDWVAMNHITADNCKLLEMLCLLLNEPELQIGAAECLLIVVSRKGKLDDRKPLMVLFGDVAMHYILSAAQTADGEGLVEKQYVFLKRLCQVLCSLGSQLCALGPDSDVEIPVNLGKYLESFLAFTTHPSQFLRSSTQITWGALFRHEVLSRDPVLLAIIPNYLRACMTNLVKMGFPSKTDCPSCEYSRFDFDSDEDFNCFFNSFRAQQGDVIRMACRLDPHTGFQMAGEWLKYQLSLPLDTGTANSKTNKRPYSIFSPSCIGVHWDAMTFFLESIVSPMFRTLDKEKIPVSQGIELLQLVLGFETKDPLILSCILSNVSALFPFVTYRPEYLPESVNIGFLESISLLCGDTKRRTFSSVPNVRRHACSSIIKICRDYPQLVLPNFDMLYNHVKQLLSNELLLTQMEKCALMEALVLISNQFKDYQRQKTLLEELMAPVATLWLSDEMKRILMNPEVFIRYVGADSRIVDPNVEDPCGLNRSRISFCVYTILGVIKRSRWPTSLEEAKAGGFVVGYTPNGNPIYRNPCSVQILKLFDNLLALIRTHNNLYMPELVAKLGDNYAKTLDMMEVEKNNILENFSKQSTLSLFCRMYNLFSSRLYLLNCSFHILGSAGSSMQQDFYVVEGLAVELLNSAFINLDNIPDYRLRPLLRVFVKPLVISCPPEYYESLICPILGPLFTYLHMRLSQKWQVINQRNTVDDNPESQEMLEEQLVRMLTREVMDLIDEEMMSTEVTPSTSSELTELGKCLMKQENVCTALLITAFTSLSWKDTLSCQRTTTQLCWPLLKQSPFSPSCLTSISLVLKGLQVHGQHNGCMAALVHLAFQIYEALRPRYAELKTVMEQVPEIQNDSLEQFDSKLLNVTLQKVADKRRKDHFKRLIAGCIGKPLGEQFRKEVHIRNLPSLFKKMKAPLGQDVFENSEEEILIALFEP